MQLTLAAAFIAGLISFVSPCVLPVVPAYLGQLGIVVATPAARWRALPQAVAFVLGFGTIFILLGLTVYVGGSVLGLTLSTDWLTGLRRLGGFVLIVLGLNLAGILRFDYLQRTWRPLDAVLFRRAATASLAMGSASGSGGGGSPAALAAPAGIGLGRSPARRPSALGRSSRWAGRPASDRRWERSWACRRPGRACRSWPSSRPIRSGLPCPSWPWPWRSSAAAS